jgi:hypothetical protein
MSGLAAHNDRGSHDERRLTARWSTIKQVPKAAPVPLEMVYRVVLDLEGLRDAFADRIVDLDVPMTEVDAVGGMTRGNCQKLLVKSDAKWSRSFGWKTLGAMLKGTGLQLVLIEDAERFAPIKAQMVQRKSKRPHIETDRP